MPTILDQLREARRMGAPSMLLEEDDVPEPLVDLRLDKYDKQFRDCVKLEDREKKRGRIEEIWQAVHRDEKADIEITPDDQLENLRRSVNYLNGRAYPGVRLPPLHIEILRKYEQSILKGLYKDEFEEKLPDFLDEYGEYPIEYVIVAITRRMGKTVSLAWFLACCMWTMLDFVICCFAVAQRTTVLLAAKILFFYHILSGGKKPKKKTVEMLIVVNMYGESAGVSTASFFPSRIEIELHRVECLLSFVRGKYRTFSSARLVSA